MALIARYHRQATPKKAHDGYGDLQGRRSGKTVRTLSAMVRLAEGLDRSHAQVVTGARRRSRAATTTSSACAPPATPSSSSGRRTGTWRRSRRCSASPLRFEVTGEPTTRNAPSHAEQPHTPHEYPGKLFVVEGIDGSGKTTQLGPAGKVA